MTDKEFAEFSKLADFCKSLLANPQWANLCEYVQRKRIDPIEQKILTATLSPNVPTFELFVYNDAMQKGKVLGITEFMKVVPFIVSTYEKELEKRNKTDNNEGAGQRKPSRPITGRRPQIQTR